MAFKVFSRSTAAALSMALATSVVGCDKQAEAPVTEPPAPVEPAPEPEEPAPRFEYPQAQRVDHTDDYHGITVADPYRWLEQPDSKETRAWIEAQNEVTFGYLETIEERKVIADRLEQLWNYERYSPPRKVGSRYVFQKNDGLQNQSVVYVLDKLDGEPRVLLDPNTLSKDGTVALSSMVFSPDGKKAAYGVADAGSDWEVWRVRDIETGKDTGDELRWMKFNEPSWTRDSKGFFYSRYDKPKKGQELEELNYNQKIYFHRLGDKQRKDALVYARPDHKEWGFDGEVTEDGRYLVITVRLGTDPKRNIFYQPLSASPPKKKGKKGSTKTVELLPGFAARYEFLGNDGSVFFFETDDGAPRGRIIAIDTKKPDKAKWKELVPEQPQTLREVEFVGNHFLATYLDNASARVRKFGRTGAPKGDVDLPGLGSVSGFKGKRKDTETFYAFQSFSQPNTIYRYDVMKGKSEVFRAPKLAFDPTDFEVKQVFVQSKDGTKVPMFLAHKKGVKPNGALPTYLYGYGGFNIPLTPRFSVPNLVWMEMGGLFAQPNLRGGGEFGEQWHQAGTKLQKQNVFDDFIAAAEWLISNDYTKTRHLSIGGRSNGGLLVGAAITQRPDLFGAALPGVGVMDMLRFNKFTIGWAWESDYGSPQNQAEFGALRAYSPYHNLEEGTEYPPTLIYTADHDDRVVPAHSFKFAAALQWAHEGDDPVMIRIDTKAGHGKGKPVSKQIEEWADLWGFLVDNLDMEVGELPAG